jgi:hypothetical protein
MQSPLMSTPPQFSFGTTSFLRRAVELSAAGEPDGDQELSSALDLVCQESRARGFTAEEMVVALRRAWYPTGWVSRSSEAPDRNYYAALGECLAIYFEEKR